MRLSMAKILVLQALLVLAPLETVAATHAPRLDVPDVCVEAGADSVRIPLVLSGADELRPSTLRTTLFYDVRQVEPIGITTNIPVHMSSSVDAASGSIDLAWHMEGRLPVRPLPAGVLASLHLRLLHATAEEPQVSLDAGQTRSLDGNGRPFHVTTSGPATLVHGSGAMWVDLLAEGETAFVASAGTSPRGQPWILRGNMSDLARSPSRVLLGSLEALETTEDGRLAADPAVPESGDAFYYLAARDDGTGSPVLGFGSDCRPRMVIPARAASR